ncbi:MAG: NDP-hexose 2,3-dehydratase family protein [Defluviitaleaceae bacterium]|nr:NDP-hexose 2,3-dehydratase family protein [Defluviitaleaceae bacterium]
MNTTKTISSLMQSWLTKTGVHSTETILHWVAELNKKTAVNIQKTTLAKTNWFYDESVGQIVNANRSFFQIAGCRQIDQNSQTTTKIIEQPIIIQNEIGFLGILCKEINGVVHMLMQAKIEPGNINKVQISPTLQATKSNFTQKHGGNAPRFLDYFLDSKKHAVVVDQIQSEQSSRFLHKRNRNIIIMVDTATEIEESPVHKWLTLGQIKSLMKIDNLVNMDTRTVLSCIPFHLLKNPINSEDTKNFENFETVNSPLLTSIINGYQPQAFSQIYQYFNNYKMFSTKTRQIVPLYSLQNWEFSKNKNMETETETETFQHKQKYPFSLIFCDIAIEGREVSRWSQPLFEACGTAFFGLISATTNGTKEFLVQAKPEIGCFDHIELAPTVQLERGEQPDNLAKFMLSSLEKKHKVLYDVVMSEEGGRFYHEQNRNAIIEVDKKDLADFVPLNGYFWLTYHTLCCLIQTNNVVNIQLRNLLSLLELECVN